MGRMGLVSVAPKPNTSRPAPEHKIYPYLLRNLTIDRPNQAWCTDLTYIRLAHGFVYLTAVMDWHSRYVPSWEVSVTMEECARVNALESALRPHGKPDIFNSDQGSQFTGQAFTRGSPEFYPFFTSGTYDRFRRCPSFAGTTTGAISY